MQKVSFIIIIVDDFSTFLFTSDFSIRLIMYFTSELQTPITFFLFVNENIECGMHFLS